VSEERDDVVVLVDEEGKEHRFSVVDIFSVKESDYAVLAPLGEKGEEGDDQEEFESAYIFRIDETGGEQTLVEVESEDEWEDVAAEWENRVRELEKMEEEDTEE